MKKQLILALVLFLTIWTGAARADTIPVTLALIVDGQSTLFDDLQGSVDGDVFSGQFSYETQDFRLDWNIRGETDPFMAIGFGVTNFTPGPLTFGFSWLMPIAPIPCTDTAGSMGGSITDANGDTATITSAFGTDIYTASLDGGTVNTLLADFYSLSTTPFSTASIPVEDFGLPGVTYPGGPVLANMGISILFTLSGNGDSAGGSANFVVQPCVPEPASMTLIGLGLAALAGRRLRRRMTRG